MKLLLLFCALRLLIVDVSGYWDMGTTTATYVRTDTVPRQSFFRWQWTYSDNFKFWFPSWDWPDILMRRKLNVVAGVSINHLCLGTAAILNRRTLITSANYLDPWMNVQRDLRVWALGRSGLHHSPYRYRVWRVTRIFPKSLNPEHSHGPRGEHSPRHDISIIHTLDQIYLASVRPRRWHYPYRTFLTPKYIRLSSDKVWFAGSGYEYLQHIAENYKIFYAFAPRSTVVDCSKYLPKFWGKFICFRNTQKFPGVPNGGPLFEDDYVIGIGCFEVRYNDESILAFTDLRYYHDYIQEAAYLEFGEYYEYAYPQWGMQVTRETETRWNEPFLPSQHAMKDLFPLGKK